jgi:hypothetical protein
MTVQKFWLGNNPSETMSIDENIPKMFAVPAIDSGRRSVFLSDPRDKALHENLELSGANKAIKILLFAKMIRLSHVRQHALHASKVENPN